MKNYYQIQSKIIQLAFKNQHFTLNRIHFSLLVMLILMLSGGRINAQIDTVIIAADYCSVPGSVQLTATPSPASASYSYSWNTNPVQTSPVIFINEAGNYIVTVNDGSGNEKSASFVVSANLVFNGDFELGNTGFTSSYLYVAPAPAALEPENRYTIDWDPHYSHKFFWGRDHTTNSGNFMIVNGVDQSATVWSQQINGILPNTDYYFSAYGISLNSSQPFANLQFSINGSQVGSITGPLPPHESGNNPPYEWVQFYGTWNSGNNTSANLSITDLEPSLKGNDFGLDDISFGTLTPFPLSLDAQSNTPCEGDFLQLTSTISGGRPPFTYTWNGPNGFVSNEANPVIYNVTQATAGTYTLKVTDANSCLPVSKDVVVSVNPPSVGGTVTGGSDICSGANSALLTLSGHTGSVVKWQRSVAPFLIWTDIANNVKTYTSGPLTETTRFRAVVQLGSCSEANSGYTTVNVENTAPVISKQAENKTVECDGNENINDLNAWLASNGGAEATDNSSAVSWTNDFSTISVVCGKSGSAAVTFTAKDACGNASTTSAIFTIIDSNPPVISALPAPSTINCPAVPEFAAATATDECSANVTLTFEDVKTDGSCAGSYSITRTWTATDACGNASNASQTINVQDVTAPVIAELPVLSTINCPAVPEFAAATATDECSANVTLTFEDVKTDGSCAGSYSITRTWTATDACGNASKASQTINVQDVTAPVIAELPAPSIINCPAVPEFAAATATDECSANVTLTFEDVKTDGSCAGSYSITRTWTATDTCGNASKASQTINVQDVTAPVIAELPAPSTINCPAVPEFATATATDECSANVTLTFEDVKTDGSCAGSYSITRTWTATDACGNSSKASQTINVQDVTAPVIACATDVFANNDPGKCGALLTIAKPSVTETCGSYTLTNSINQTDDASGEYPIGTTLVVWTAKDDCGNSSTCTMTVTVNDTEKPVVSCAADINTCSGNQPVLINPTASDNCGIASVTNNAPAIFETGTTLVLWTVTDIHGNVTTCTQTVIIAPQVTVDAGTDDKLCSAIPYTISKATASNYTSVTWSHNGHGNLSATNVLNPVYTPSAGETGTIEFTLVARGNAACGNGEVQDKFSLIIYAPLTVDAGENSTILSGATATLHGTASGGSGILSYNWIPADKLVDNSKQNPVTVPLFTTTTFTLNVVDALSACTLSDAVTINVDDVARPIARDDHATTNLTHTITVDVQQNDTDPVGLGLVTTISVAPNHGNASVNENGSITYTNLPNYTGKDIYDTLTYTICDKGTPVKCSSAKVFILIPLEREEEIEVFNLLTPNGDGENDYWHIEGINNTENEIKIFNRWGDKIVKTFINYNNSGNRWEGKNDKNETLPDGVYFYIIKIKDKETKTGWIYLRGEGSK